MALYINGKLIKEVDQEKRLSIEVSILSAFNLIILVLIMIWIYLDSPHSAAEIIQQDLLRQGYNYEYIENITFEYAGKDTIRKRTYKSSEPIHINGEFVTYWEISYPTRYFPMYNVTPITDEAFESKKY